MAGASDAGREMIVIPLRFEREFDYGRDVMPILPDIKRVAVFFMWFTMTTGYGVNGALLPSVPIVVPCFAGLW